MKPKLLQIPLMLLMLTATQVLADSKQALLTSGILETGAASAPLTDAGGQPVLVKLDNGCDLLAIAKMAKARYSVVGYKLLCADGTIAKTQGMLVDSDSIAGIRPDYKGDLAPGIKVRYLQLSAPE